MPAGVTCHRDSPANPGGPVPGFTGRHGLPGRAGPEGPIEATVSCVFTIAIASLLFQAWLACPARKAVALASWPP